MNEPVTWEDCEKCELYAVVGLPAEKATAAEKPPSPNTEPAVPSLPCQTAPFDAPLVNKNSTKRSVVLINSFSPGDILVFEAAVASIHKCYPGKFDINVVSSCPPIFENNPHVVGNYPLGSERIFPAKTEVLTMHYPLIHQSNQLPVHMMESFVDFLRDHLHLPALRLMFNRPRLYITDEEKGWVPQVHEKPFFGRPTKYWLVNAGHKSDAPLKQWNGYQRVVDAFAGRILFVQVGEANKEHLHPPLKGVLNMVGQTDLRQLIRMAHHAQGMLTGVSFLMHAAGALEKPAVVLAGGREPRAWNTYPAQTYLSTIGQLDCCKGGGCWKGKVKHHEDAPIPAEQNIGVCSRPVLSEPAIGACMALIEPEQVIAAIEGYYRGGALSY